MTKPERLWAPHLSQRDQLYAQKPKDLAEHVDVAFEEFMRAVLACIPGARLKRSDVIEWLFANMAATGGYGWTQEFADRWNIRFAPDNPYVGMTMREFVERHKQGLPNGL